MLAARRRAGDRLVPAMSLAELLQSDAPALAGTAIDGMQLDSRRVAPGDLFLAMPGDVHDGRQFIEQAVANGASAILAEAPAAGFVDDVPVPLVEVPDLRLEAGHLAARFYRYPSRDMHVVGVTGTNGKTTTSRLVAQLARARGRTCGAIGTLGATLTDEVGEAGTTTPDALALQRQFAEWRRRGVAMASMEVSSHALVQGRVNGVQFDTAVFTNLSRDHLDYHRGMGAYARAKLRLFATPGLRHAVINVDDDLAALVAAAAGEKVRSVTYSGSGRGADVRVSEVAAHAAGLRARLHSPWGEGLLDSPLPGGFNLANLTAALTVMLLAGEDLRALLETVSQLQPVPGRMQSVPNALGLQVIVDYAHTPDALAQALAALRPHVAGALITVFGCGGDRDPGKRQLMGRVAGEHSDRVIVTSDNPRAEDPRAIIADIESGLRGAYSVEPDRAAAIHAAIAGAAPGDCVLIAGKGHENYQLVEGRKLPFSDAAEAAGALRRRERQ